MENKLDLSQGYPSDFSILSKEEIQEIINWELSVFVDKSISIDYISNNIYVGNYHSALSEETLKENGITHIVLAGKDMIALHPHKFEYKILPLYDSPYLKLRKFFDDANKFINQSLEKSKENKILIHCASGISRSVSIAIGYFIGNCGMKYDEALMHVKNKRKIAKPNQGFEKDLRDYSYEIHKSF